MFHVFTFSFFSRVVSIVAVGFAVLFVFFFFALPFRSRLEGVVLYHASTRGGGTEEERGICFGLLRLENGREESGGRKGS